MSLGWVNSIVICFLYLFLGSLKDYVEAMIKKFKDKIKRKIESNELTLNNSSC